MDRKDYEAVRINVARPRRLLFFMSHLRPVKLDGHFLESLENQDSYDCHILNIQMQYVHAIDLLYFPIWILKPLYTGCTIKAIARSTSP